MLDGFYLPPDYLFLDPRVAADRVKDHRRRLGAALAIHAHPWVRPDLIELADVVGDGTALAGAARATSASILLAVGPRWQAENAALLAPAARVLIAEPETPCPMAEPMTGEALRDALEQVAARGPTVPVIGVTSSLPAKEACGTAGGLTCGARDAPAALSWALERADRVLFGPDVHGGRAAARTVGLVDDEVVVGVEAAAGAPRARLVLLSGACPVQAAFLEEDVDRLRAAHPGLVVLAHTGAPIAARADHATDALGLLAAIDAAPPDAPIAIATEGSWFGSLTEARPERTLIAVTGTLCASMYASHPASVLFVLDHLADPGERTLSVTPESWPGARAALERMLSLDAAPASGRQPDA